MLSTAYKVIILMKEKIINFEKLKEENIRYNMPPLSLI